MSFVFVALTAESVFYDNQDSSLVAENLKDSTDELKSLIDLLATPTPTDFNFNGGIFTLQDSGFRIFNFGVTVKKDLALGLEIEGSVSLAVDGRLNIGPVGGVTLRSL